MKILEEILNLLKKILGIKSPSKGDHILQHRKENKKMKILEGKEKVYKDWYDINNDGYSRACFTYAERWANMLENLIESSDEDAMTVIVNNADRLSHEADIEGITGFMYGCAVNILAQCWKYGEELRKWHNKEYNYNGDGVVNPAVLTIKKK